VTPGAGSCRARRIGLIGQLNGVTVTVFAFEVADDRISRIWAIRNPDKLRPWTAD